MKKVFSFILMFVLTIVLVLPVNADYQGNWSDMPKVDNSKYVHDLGGFLTDSEIFSLETKMKHIVDTYHMSAVIVTTKDSLGRTAKAYGEDFYEANGYGVGEAIDGVVFVIDMDSREIDLRAYGKARRLFTTTNVDYILDAAVEHLKVSDSNIYPTANEFAVRAEQIFASWQVYINSGGVEDYTVKQASPVYFSIPMILLIGFGLSGIVVLFMRISHNKSLPGALPAQHYIVDNSLNYRDKSDTFISTHTTRSRKPDPPSSGGGGGISFSGGSSSGMSSSGSSTSGGSRSF